MGIDKEELEEYLRQEDVLDGENFLAEDHNISEEDIRENESREREF